MDYSDYEKLSERFVGHQPWRMDDYQVDPEETLSPVCLRIVFFLLYCVLGQPEAHKNCE